MCATLLAWLGAVALLTFATAAAAQIVLEQVDVIATRAPVGLGTAETASEGYVSPERIKARPVYRPGEVLENVPGLIITQHSGEGKANQYFLRGFNLDHGTDFAIYVDGMPINMPTHGHGQGYADINWLMPELLGGVIYRKGPYFADEGDFSSVGAAHIELRDRLDRDFVSGTTGSFGYFLGLGATSKQVAGGNLISAAEIGHYDEPWQNPDDLQKLNGLVRYTRGTPDDGFSITGLAYGARWNSTDQIPQRAVTDGLIDRFGAIDPTDGGTTQRYSLSGRWAERDGDSVTRANAYFIASDLRLYNDFTFFLRDPVNGDQFRQSDRRFVFGGALSRTYQHQLFGDAAETTIGLQTRYDRIDVGLFNTAQRNILSVVRDDTVDEASTGFYAQNTLHWTPWLRTNLGLRGDVFYGNDRSNLAINSGSLTRGIASPKAGIVFGPFGDVEFYGNAGMGYHSNDVRGATIRLDPNDQVSALSRVPLLVRSKGAEIGSRVAIADTLQASAAILVLDFDSELVFLGDAGTTEASRPEPTDRRRTQRAVSASSLVGARYRRGGHPGALHRYRSRRRPHPRRGDERRQRRCSIRQAGTVFRCDPAALFRPPAADRGQQRHLQADAAIVGTRWLSPDRERRGAPGYLQPARQHIAPDRLFLRLAACRRAARRRQ
jgi:TonB dependent receptor-like, beta-barrel/TonB-dependent Receptor Plug Domain